MSHIYNYKFQKPDIRDYGFIPTNFSITPSSSYCITDNPSFACPIFDQGALGSCLANALKAMMYILSRGGVNLSRLQLYMCYRAIDGSSLTTDSGGTVRAGMKAISSYGVCPETTWPYIIANFARLAPNTAFTSTYKLNNFVYTAVQQDIDHLKMSISLNLPIVAGIFVYTSFESANVGQTGVIPVPDIRNEKLLGGHAILLVGYNDTAQVFKFQNSWSMKWGDKGYGYIPYSYILNTGLTRDVWNMYFNL